MFHILKPFCISTILLMGCMASVFSHAETAVGVLKSKQHLVEIFAGEDGPLYSVKNLKGELLASRLTDTDLLDKFPALEPVIRGYADDASLSPQINKPMDILQRGN